MSVPYYGDFADNDTVNLPFNTFSSDDPAASVTATDLADADIYVHKDGSATAITTDGATIDIDAPGVGAHMVTIDTNADAAYTTGSEYAVRVDGVTVDGGTVNAWIGAFSIERAGGALALIKAGVTLAAGAVTDASLAGGLEIVFETDFGTNYNTTRNAWVNNYTDIIGTMDAAAFGADFLTAAKIADGAFVAANFAASSLDGKGNWNIGKTGYALIVADWASAGDAMDLVANAVDSTSVATGALTATKFAADAIDAAALKTDAVTEIVGGIWNAVMASYQVDGSFGLAANAIDAGTAQAGAAGTITLDAGSASTTADLYNGAKIKLVGGTGAGQTRRITDYAVTSRIASVEPNWITNPGADTKYIVVPGGYADLRTATQASVDAIEADSNELQQDDVPGLIATAQSDLDTLTGSDGVTLATAQGNYAPATAAICTEARLAELDAANLPTATDTAVTDLANATDGLGALKALIDTVTTDVGTVNSDLGNATDGLGALKTLIDALNDISSANVLTQVNAALDTAIAELGVAAPTATPTFRTAVMLIYMAILQKRDTTATSDEIHNAADTAIASASVSDDGVTFSKAKYT